MLLEVPLRRQLCLLLSAVVRVLEVLILLHSCFYCILVPALSCYRVMHVCHSSSTLPLQLRVLHVLW